MQNRKILVVEDEFIIGKWLARTLTKLGYEVTNIVASGEEAIKEISVNIPDLILMDIVIQGDMDGIETAMKIQENHNIPIIYVTAYADDETIDRAEKTNFYGYILKPLKEKQIQATIRIAWQKHEQKITLEKSLENSTTDQNQSRYVAIASHDLRVPLSTIQTSVELLRDYDDKLTEQKKQNLLEKIHLSSVNMNQLIEDLLTMYQWELGTREFKPELIDIKEFIEDLIYNIQIIAKDNHQFILDLPSTDNLIKLDQKLLKHIMYNLISNAIKYSPHGGEITIKVDREPDKINIKIEDQGIGIPPEYQNKMFQEFERAHNVGNIKGTGLGLSIVKQAVELHRGKITFQSQLGRGTKFTILLPINDD
jgi:signal transduction histidine kinase